jgi:PAS domain S-box-containing protein
MAPGSALFRVLLVEDNRGDSILIGEALRDVRDGVFAIERAASLAEGLALAAARPFDAVLLDLGLPDSQGPETLTAMLAACSEPVLVITGLDNEELGLEAIHRGAQDYLVKGRTSDEVLRRSLRYAIERARLRAATTSPLIETAPIGLAVLDRDLRYLYVNPAMAQIDGLPPLAHLGHRFDGVATDQSLDAVELLERAIETGEPILELEISGRTRASQGTLTWLLSAEPLRDASGATVGLAASLVDITERKHKEEALAALAESRSQAQAIGETLAYGIWICDPDGGLRYASQSFLDLLGVSLEEASGLGWTRAMDEEAVAPMLRAWDECRSCGGQWEYELSIQGSDDRRHTVLSRGHAIRDEAGQVKSWAGINLDITERKEAEAFRDAFVGVLSHELRTPITSISAATTLLRRPSVGRAERAELVTDIGEEAERLRRLVENFLVLARAERGGLRVEIEPIVLAHIARDVLNAERRLWPSRRFELTVAERVPVACGDEMLVGQVLGNLLSNAAKFGPADGSVRVAIDAPEGHPRVRVLDEGPGIEPDEAERLFELFYRSQRTARVSGSGIGLFVARQLVEAMDGRIWASRREDSPGSEFGIELKAFADDPA